MTACEWILLVIFFDTDCLFSVFFFGLKLKIARRVSGIIYEIIFSFSVPSCW